MEIIEQGTILNDKYEVGKLIGEGGMSIVYEGTDVSTGMPVALKVLKGDYMNDEKRVEKLRKEALSLRALRHPNIVKVFGIGHKSGMHYIAMEKIDGVTISEIVNEGGPLGWQDSSKIIIQMLDALRYTHAQGVIHKDIKPQNILIDENKHATLTDFGIAENRATRETINAGENEFSVYYMSPEQARAGTCDQRSDIYSLGVTFYEMLVGSMPFDGDTQYAVILKIVNNNIIPAHVVDSQVPRAISDVVTMATMRDPNKRFQTADEMLTALKKAISNPDAPLLPNRFYEDNNIVLSENDVQNQAVSAEVVGNVGIKSDEDFAYDDEDEEEHSNVGEKLLKILAYVIAAVLAIVMIAFVVNFTKNKLDPKLSAGGGTYYLVKSYEGHKADEVVAMLNEAGIGAKCNSVSSDLYPSGYILNQKIAPGTKITQGTTLELDVIARNGYMVLDDYTGQAIDPVKRIFSTKNLTMEIEYVSSSLTKDYVVSTLPKGGEEVEIGGKVTFYISRGNVGKTAFVPDLCSSGMTVTLEQAITKLNAAGLTVGKIYPQPGADLTEYYEAKMTPSPTPEMTEEPSPVPTETPFITPEITETPSETPTEEIQDTGLSDNTENPDGEDVTDETPVPETEMPSPTPKITPAPTDTPEPTEVPTEEPTPTINPEYQASFFVVEQYPQAGTETYEGASVDLYFVPRRTLDFTLGRTMIVEVEIPANELLGGPALVYIEYVLEDGERLALQYANIEKNVITVEVPFGWDGNVTTMNIRINDMNKIYEKKVVKYADSQANRDNY